MEKLKVLALAVASIVTAGCATATNSQEEINHYAELYYYSQLCTEAGMLDRETAAKGMSIATRNIYRSDTPRFQAKTKELWDAGTRPTQNICTGAQRYILTAEAARETKATTAVPANPLPRQTTCSTYFGQTHCTTY